MAQRTPIRSILSAVPSKPASDETSTESRSHNQSAGQLRNVSEEKPRRERRRDTRKQRRQPPQEQPPQARSGRQRQPVDKDGNGETELFSPDRVNPRNEPQPVSPLPTKRRGAGSATVNSRQSQTGNPVQPASRTSLNSARRTMGDIKPYRPSSTTPRSQKRTVPVQPVEPRPSRQTQIPASQQSSASRQSAKQPPQNSTSKTHKPATQPPRQRKKGTPKNQPRQQSTSPLVYGTRMLILGVGIGVIAGTLLSVFDPASRYPASETVNHASVVAQSGQSQQSLQSGENNSAQASQLPDLQLGEELVPVKNQMQALVAQNAELSAGAFFVNLDTGAYIDLDGSGTFAAASTIKVPILIAFFQDVDEGKIRLDERLTMSAEQIAEGSGDMQLQPPGTKYSALETATKMITISDNTATNMLIDRLGGAVALNQRFLSWGLSTTAIRNVLPDLEGTNTTSPKDMANLLALVHQGKLVSLRSRDRLLAIMQGTLNNSLLPQGLEPGATIAHKTGDIGSLVGDVGIIDLPTGKRYIAAVMVKRPHNDERGSELIQQFSRMAYQSFSK